MSEPRRRFPHWMGEPDYARENAAHDLEEQKDFEDAQDEAERAASNRYADDYRGGYS